MGEPVQGCLFCNFAGDPSLDRANLVLERGRDWFIVINRYPYTTGHVMVVSMRHVEKVSDLADAASAEMVQLLARC
jgi:ATP adenylyltransferase